MDKILWRGQDIEGLNKDNLLLALKECAQMLREEQSSNHNLKKKMFDSGRD